MTRLFAVTLTLLPALVLLPALASAQTPEERGLQISVAAEKANDGFKSETSEMAMILINSQGDKTTRKMSSQSLEMSGDGDRSLITFKWPADVKGTRMLTWSHKKKRDDQWLYLPSLRKVKRLSSRNKSGSFMGSEFAYEDLASQEVEKYEDYFYMGDETIEGRKTQKIRRVPTDRKSGYSKQIVWMDPTYQSALKIEYYDRKGELLKTMTFSNFKKFGRYHRAGKINVVNHQTQKKSELSWTDRKLGADVDTSEFESEGLSE
ncbi:MAG: hypothetical protein ACI9OJ_000601 [Myxococcota bacterium]|jgi:hypothetical protein